MFGQNCSWWSRCVEKCMIQVHTYTHIYICIYIYAHNYLCWAQTILWVNIAFLGASWVISDTSLSDYFGEDGFQILMLKPPPHRVQAGLLHQGRKCVGKKMKKLWKISYPWRIHGCLVYVQYVYHQYQHKIKIQSRQANIQSSHRSVMKYLNH